MPTTPPDRRPGPDPAGPAPDEGGDPACALPRVCPGCGRLDDGEPPARCPGCGTPLTTE
jgi:hypothetical protein